MGPAVHLAFDERRGRLATVDTEGAMRIFGTKSTPAAVTGPAGGRKGSPGLHAFFTLTDDLLLSVWDGVELDAGSRVSLLDSNAGLVKETYYALGGFSEEIITNKDRNSDENHVALHRELLRSPPILADGGRFLITPSASGLELVSLVKGQKRVSPPIEQRLAKACMAAVSASTGALALVRVSDEVFEKLDADYRSPNF